MNRKLVIAGVVSALSLASLPAMAWGEREQGILIGIVGGHILSQIHKNSTSYSSPGIVYRDHDRPGNGRGYGYGHSRGYSGYSGHGNTVVIREIVREPTVVYHTPPVAVAPARVCRELPVRNESGHIIEFRQLCD